MSAPLSRRLQVLVDDERLSRLQRESERTGAPVGAIVRDAIDAKLGRGEGPEAVAAAAKRLLDADPMPVEDWEVEKGPDARRALRRVGAGRLSRFLYDTNVFVYAVGGAHPLREPCREVLRHAEAGRLSGEASPDLLQEFLHQRARKAGDRMGAVGLARDVARLCRFHDLTEADAMTGLELFERYEQLSARDAAFAAFALNRDIPAILSVNRDLDGIPGLLRVDPADGASFEALLSPRP